MITKYPRFDAEGLKLGGDLVPILVVGPDRPETVGLYWLAAHRPTELKVNVANGVLSVEVHQVGVAATLVLGGLTIEPDAIPG